MQLLTRIETSQLFKPLQPTLQARFLMVTENHRITKARLSASLRAGTYKGPDIWPDGTTRAASVVNSRPFTGRYKVVYCIGL
jgi:hypothetical protein